MKKLIPLLLLIGVVALAFAQETGSIAGVVTDSVTSNPIVGTRVNAMGGHHQRGGYAITNENGQYLIENLQPGSYQVSAVAQGYLVKHYPEPVAVVAGQTTPDINFALAPMPPPPLPGGISGIVTDSATGNPIADANVEACGHTRGHARTNINGEYLIENLLPGDYRVTATAQGYLPKHYPDMVTVLEGQVTPSINFALAPFVRPPTGSISGIVTDSVTGNPIAHAMVMVHVPPSHNGPHGRAPGVAFTDNSGAYVINNLLPGNYQVEANARGYTHKIYPDSVTVVEYQTTPNINFALAPYIPPQPGSISGIVTDSTTGAPIAGAVVMAMKTGRHPLPGGRAITNADGTYTIENLMSGEYRVITNAQGYEHKVYPDPVVVQEGQNTPNINFVLVPHTQNLKVNPQIRLNPTNTRPSRAGR